jgi:hypothetical protein
LLATFQIAGLLLGLALLPGQTAPPPNRGAELRTRFASESDAVRRAKLMVPLGDAEFQEIRKRIDDGKLDDALAILREYRDEAQSCQKELDAKGVDPEKRPSGFKQLQISLRESLRRLDDLLANLSADEQKPFLDLRKDIDQLDRHLIRELFPRQPGAATEPTRAKG